MTFNTRPSDISTIAIIEQADHVCPMCIHRRC